MSQLWLNQELIPIDPGFTYLIMLWDGKVCRLPPGEHQPKEKKERRGLGRRGRTPPDEEEKRGEDGHCKKSREVQKIRKPQVCTRLCCPSLPTLHTALSQSNPLARDGEGMVLCRVWKERRGSCPGEPCCVAQGHCAPLHLHSSLRALPMGIRGRSHPRANASSSSLLGYQQFLFPRERGTKPCLLLPLWLYQCFLALSL